MGLCIPASDRKTRETLLLLHHDVQNHFGRRKTRLAITRDYFWPGLDHDVKEYIRSCDSCARNKTSTQPPTGLLHPMLVPSNRFSEMALNFVGPVPKSNGFDMILGMTDRLTNYVKLELVHSTATAQEMADVVCVENDQRKENKNVRLRIYDLQVFRPLHRSNLDRLALETTSVGTGAQCSHF
jgi:hypothetical protein